MGFIELDSSFQASSQRSNERRKLKDLEEHHGGLESTLSKAS